MLLAIGIPYLVIGYFVVKMFYANENARASWGHISEYIFSAILLAIWPVFIGLIVFHTIRNRWRRP